MGAGAVVLDGEQGGPPVLRAGTRGSTTVARMFPKTLVVRTAVAGMGVVTPDGMIVRSGALLPSAATIHTPPAGGLLAQAHPFSALHILSLAS